MLAKTLARSIDCTVRRIQFTPDLLPSDITGVSVFNQDAAATSSSGRARSSPTSSWATRSTARRPRPSRRCWSRMEERQVTVDGQTYDAARRRSSSWPRRTRSRWRAPTPSPRPSATGSWRGSRWATPRPRAEVAMLDTHGGASPLRRPAAGHRRRDHRRGSCDIGPRRPRQPGHPSVRRRPQHAPPGRARRCGSGPHRAPRCTCSGPRAPYAALEGRDHVLPDDVQGIVVPVLAHRLILSGETQLARRTGAGRARGILLRRVPVPPSAAERRASCARLRGRPHRRRGRAFVALGHRRWCSPGRPRVPRPHPRRRPAASPCPLVTGAALRAGSPRRSGSSGTPRRPRGSRRTSDAIVTLTIENVGTRRTPLLLAEERLDYAPRRPAAVPRSAARRG